MLNKIIIQLLFWWLLNMEFLFSCSTWCLACRLTCGDIAFKNTFFRTEIVKRIWCYINRTLWSWWSLLFSLPVCWIMYWSCKGKLAFYHFWVRKSEILSILVEIQHNLQNTQTERIEVQMERNWAELHKFEYTMFNLTLSRIFVHEWIKSHT